ncbi:MAG: hypothetical protein JNN30_22350 [Rhodanobacteraceae bacterium]|nr:hypothetical protein [Rhodanobacteraceae bacterium]
MPELTPQRWQQTQPLLEKALDLDADSRTRFVADQCLSDPEPGVELRALLADYAEEGLAGTRCSL